MVPYQEAPAPPMTPELRERCAEAMHVLAADGVVHVGGNAVVFVYEQLGWGSLVRPLTLPPLSWLREPGYRWVANNRRLVSRFAFRTPE